MGHLGWTPYEYYTSSPYEFHAACEGYFDKRRVEESWFRNVALLNLRVMGNKQSAQEVWPMDSDKPTPEVVKRTKEEYDRIINRYKKK